MYEDDKPIPLRKEKDLVYVYGVIAESLGEEVTC